MFSFGAAFKYESRLHPWQLFKVIVRNVEGGQRVTVPVTRETYECFSALAVKL
jgi:hypothetical protein